MEQHISSSTCVMFTRNKA